MKKLVLFLSFIILIVSTLLYVVFYTQKGLEWGVLLFHKFFPQKIQIESFEGRLADRLNVKNLIYKEKSFHVYVSKLSLRFSFRSIWHGTFIVDNLNVQNLRIESQSEGDTTNERFSYKKIYVPLNVRIKQAKVIDVFYTQKQKKWHLNKIYFSGSAWKNSFKIREFFISRNDFHLKSNGKIRMDKNPNGFLNFSFNKDLGDQEQIEGEGKIDGSLDDFKWEQRFSKTGDVTFSIFIKGGIHDRTVESSYEINYSDWKPKGKVKVEIKENELFIPFFLLESPSLVSSLNIHGSIQKTGFFSFSGFWDQLNLPFPEKFKGVSPSGKISAEGTLNKIKVGLEAKADAPGILPASADIKVLATVKGKMITWTKAFLKHPRFVLFSAGSCQLGSELSWKGKIKGKTDDLKAWYPHLAGKLFFYGNFEGRKKGNQLLVKTLMPMIKGELWDNRVLGKIDLITKEGKAFFDFNADYKNHSLFIHGIKEEQWNVEWDLKSPESLSARMIGSGFVKGKESISEAVAVLEGNNLSFADYSLQDVFLKLRHQGEERGNSFFKLQMKHCKKGKIILDDFVARGKGVLNDHTIQIRSRTRSLSAKIDAKGSLTFPLWDLTLTGLSLDYPDYFEWNLAFPANIHVSSKKIVIPELSLISSNEAFLALSLNKDVSGLKAEGKIRDLPVSLINPFLSVHDLKIDNMFLGGNVTFEKNQDIEMKVDLQTTAAVIKSSFPEQALDIPTAAGRLKGDYSKDKLLVKWHFPFMDKSLLEGNFMISSLTENLKNAFVSGALKVKFEDLNLIQSYIPYISYLSGNLNLETQVSGTLNAPEFNGALNTDNLAFRIPKYGVDIKNSSFEIRGNQQSLALKGEFFSGKGGLKVIGGLAKSVLQVRIDGESFSVMNTPSLWISASPELLIKRMPDQLEITGKIFVPEASIRGGNSQEKIVPSEDVIIVGEKKNTFIPKDFYTRIKILAGQNIQFDGYGISAGVEGSIELRQSPGELTQSFGELALKNGKYKAFGQELIIRKGNLIYVGGPLSNPGLDVEAIRKTGEIKTGIRVTGTLNDPNIEIFSSPSLSETEEISYLLLGRPLNQASKAEQQFVYNTVLSLGIEGGERLAKKIASILGIEEIEIQQGSDQPSLVLGRSLTPDIYLSYGVGLFDPVSTLRIRYQISSKWVLQTEYGALSGIDLLYRLRW